VVWEYDLLIDGGFRIADRRSCAAALRWMLPACRTRTLQRTRAHCRRAALAQWQMVAPGIDLKGVEYRVAQPETH